MGNKNPILEKQLKELRGKLELASSLIVELPGTVYLIVAIQQHPVTGNRCSGFFTNIIHQTNIKTGEQEPATIGLFVDMLVEARMDAKVSEIKEELLMKPMSTLKQ